MMRNGWGETYYQGCSEPAPPPRASKIFKEFEEIFDRRESRAAPGGWGKGIENCELQIVNCGSPASSLKQFNE
jgi:hypothetical protein